MRPGVAKIWTNEAAGVGRAPKPEKPLAIAPPLHAPRFEHLQLRVVEHPGANEKAEAAGRLQRESAPAPWHHVDRQLRVLPVLELLAPHVERAPLDLAQEHVALTEELG